MISFALMDIHQLAIFWRDAQARCFTSMHFRARHPEERARQILSTVAQLSLLQIHGAVLDYKPLDIELLKPPPPTGTAERLIVDLYPNAELDPRAGITLIKFSIPSPVDELAVLGETVRPNLDKPCWIMLEEAVFPYLCLPNGIMLKPIAGKERIKRIVLLTLTDERAPRPGEPPIDAAIAATQEDLEGARAHIRHLQSIQQSPTLREMSRVNRYEERLKWLHTLQQLEQEFFVKAEEFSSLLFRRRAEETREITLQDAVMSAFAAAGSGGEPAMRQPERRPPVVAPEADRFAHLLESLTLKTLLEEHKNLMDRHAALTATFERLRAKLDLSIEEEKTEISLIEEMLLGLSFRKVVQTDALVGLGEESERLDAQFTGLEARSEDVGFFISALETIAQLARVHETALIDAVSRIVLELKPLHSLLRRKAVAPRIKKPAVRKARKSRKSRKRTLTTLDVSIRLGVSVKTVRNWCRSGRLRAEKSKGCWQISARALETFLRSARS